MKVDLLFIFFNNEEYDKEVCSGAEALRVRNATKLGLDRVFSLGMEEVKNGPVEVKLPKLPENKDSNSNTLPTVGVYFVGHSGLVDHCFGSYSAKDLADFLVDFLKEAFQETKVELKKVCLLNCDVAVADPHMADGSYLQQFCTALGGKGFVPKVAGWDCFVTICFAGMEINNNPYTETRISKKDKLPITTDDYGRKVVEPQFSCFKGSKVVVSRVKSANHQEKMRKQKFVYVYKEGNPVRLDTAEWSKK